MSRCDGMGERALVRRISEILGGIESEDCALIWAGDRYLVATTDMLHRKTDFPEIMTSWQIGWMTAAVNLSDIAAMGAEPAGLLVAAGLPPETDLYLVDELFCGLQECAACYGTRVLGGDTDAHDELTLTGCALGFVERDLVLLRRGAHAGDLLCTTGALGGAGGGLLAIERGDLENDLVPLILEPQPRVAEGRALALSRSVTSMMDNSDGLALSLWDLAEASGVGFVVREKDLPIAPGLEEMVGHREAVELVMGAGGDFELLFTVPPDRLEEARRACRLTVIGRAVDEGVWLESGGRRIGVEPEGYEHRIGCKGSYRV